MHVTPVRDTIASSDGGRRATVRGKMDHSLGVAESVAEELRFDCRVDAERIVVDGYSSTIVLRGAVRTYAEKCRAAQIAGAIRGVAAVENELEVRLAIGGYRTDDGLEQLAAVIMQNHSALSDPLPRVTSRDGWLTIGGVVTTKAQKRAAEEALRSVTGIRGITNLLEVEPTADVTADKTFPNSVQRRARLAVNDIRVEVHDRTLTIHGTVASYEEHDALIELASSRRGIVYVDDHVVVRPSVASNVRPA